MSNILVVGATGNIGAAVISAALRTKRSVLAIVRNQDSAEKLFKHIGTREGITTVEADVTSEDGVQGVVDQVKAGELPAFQHVYSSVGRWESTPLKKLSTQTFRDVMNVNVESNYFAYRATMPYLLEQKDPDSTWTIITGAADQGTGGVTGMSQGAIISMVKAIAREDADTNVRVNEMYLSARVDYDSVAEKKGGFKSSELGKIYEQLLARPDIKSSRILIRGREDVDELKHESLLKV